MKLVRSLLGLAAACALAGSPAYAQTSTSLDVKDGNGVHKNIAVQSDASSNLHYRDVVEGIDSGGAPHPILVNPDGLLHATFDTPPVVVIAGVATAANQATDIAILTTLVSHSPALNGDGGVPVHLNNASFPADALTTGTIASGTPNAAFTVTLASGEGVTAFAVSGLTASGATLSVEGSNDGGTTWTAINEIGNAGGLPVSTLTADGQFRISTGGRTKVRLRISVTGSGTITVAANASTANSLVAIASAAPLQTNIAGTPTSTSVTVTTHGTFQTLLAASTARQGCMVENRSTDTILIALMANGSAGVDNSMALGPATVAGGAGGAWFCNGNGSLYLGNIAVSSLTSDGVKALVISQ